MNKYYLIALLISCILGLFIEIKLRKRELKTGSNEKIILKGVGLVIDKKRTAFKNSLLILLFCLFTAVPIIIISPSVLPYILLMTVVFSVLSFVINYNSPMPIQYNYRGYTVSGFVESGKAMKNYLILSSQGVRGLIKVSWRKINSYQRLDPKTISFKTKRLMNWLYKLLRADEVKIYFDSELDANTFETYLRKQKEIKTEIT